MINMQLAVTKVSYSSISRKVACLLGDKCGCVWSMCGCVWCVWSTLYGHHGWEIRCFLYNHQFFYDECQKLWSTWSRVWLDLYIIVERIIVHAQHSVTADNNSTGPHGRVDIYGKCVTCTYSLAQHHIQDKKEEGVTITITIKITDTAKQRTSS